MKCVIDTNVMISGMFWQNNYCFQILKLITENRIMNVTSDEILNELERLLLTFKIRLSYIDIKIVLDEIRSKSLFVSSTTRLNVINQDESDNKFIEAAVAGQVDFVITQDRHLLKLKKYQHIQILNPKDFLQKLHQRNQKP